MKHFSLFLLLIFFAICSPQANALIIHVPADSATIQGAVNGAEHGDTILVAPGVYNENVECTCKAILLASHYLFDHDTLTIDSTIIDGVGGDALSLLGGDCLPENKDFTVMGFTIRNSTFGVWKEMWWWFEEPRSKSRICHCKFIDNTWGIHTLTWDSCAIDHNTFINNTFGIECYGGAAKDEEKLLPPSCTTIVENNVFSFNSWHGAGAFGAAIAIFRNNIFSQNAYGISMGYFSSLKAVRNVIFNNSMGVYCWLNDNVDTWVTIENNIIAANDTGIYMWGYIERAQIRYNDVNSLLENFIGCPTGVGNTTWGTNFNGTPCDSFYNIVRNPLFADTIDFELLCNSPCIDAGDSSIQVPDSGGCRIDIGKNEFHYVIGDATSDYVINISDVIFVINYLFLESPAPCPYHSADANCDGTVDVGDIVCLINYLFCGSPIPCF